MEWLEKLMWAGLVLVLISWGLVIIDAWSLLVAHLTKINWMMIAFTYLAALSALISVYRNTLKGTTIRGHVLVAAMAVIDSWAEAFYLMQKIGQ